MPAREVVACRARRRHANARGAVPGQAHLTAGTPQRAKYCRCGAKPSGGKPRADRSWAHPRRLAQTSIGGTDRPVPHDGVGVHAWDQHQPAQHDYCRWQSHHRLGDQPWAPAARRNVRRKSGFSVPFPLYLSSIFHPMEKCAKVHSFFSPSAAARCSKVRGQRGLQWRRLGCLLEEGC